MDKIIDWLKLAAAAIGGIFVWLWGPCDSLIVVLAAAVALDYVTGVINAFIHKKASSKTGWEGLLKKVFIFLLVALGSLIDRVIPSANGAVRAAVLVFYIANEGLSILENAGAMGLPLPEALKKALSKLSEKSESGE
ncbi:MAG: Holin family protein [Firmicutes bacterium ADurb.Bin182]|nr:MAG: Holin family protein [Firmicutes bacterium ADurb.Bin182]